jgi:type II secretory pathway pseudopilin PulG
VKRTIAVALLALACTATATYAAPHKDSRAVATAKQHVAAARQELKDARAHERDARKTLRAKAKAAAKAASDKVMAEAEGK